MYIVNMFRDTLKLPVETLDNLFIAPVNIEIIESFMYMVGYQGVVDKVGAFYTKFLAQPCSRDADFGCILAKEIRATDDYKEHETVFVNVVEGENDQESYADKFTASMLHDDIDDSGNRIEPGSHKENSKVVDDDEHQLYLNMKLKPQDQAADPKLCEILKEKFEKPYVSSSSYSYDIFACHDEHLTDADPPEGREKGKKVNLTAPTLTCLGIEAHEPNSIVDKPTTGLIYLNIKDEKRVLYLVEIDKFCDATLERVFDEVKLRIF
nr:hypothetical protein [Tanacetum cinerariifolium]